MSRDSESVFKRKRVKLLFLLLLVFIVWVGFTLYGQWEDLNKKKLEIAELEQLEERILNEKTKLEREKILLNNYDYIAEIAREYYFMSKPGEIIIISPNK